LVKKSTSRQLIYINYDPRTRHFSAIINYNVIANKLQRYSVNNFFLLII